MADKAISELVAAPSVTPDSLFVLQQDGTAKKLTAQVLENWLLSFAGGHGGIQSYELLKTVGLVKTYRFTLADQSYMDIQVTDGRGINSISKTGTSGLVDTYRITYNDGSTGNFTITNGAKGDKGDNTYIWIKYASKQPTASSHSFGDIPDAWIGIYFGQLESAPTDWTQYKWYQWKGEKGDTGEPATLISAAVTYQAGTSGTVIPSGSWSSAIPTVSQGQYLWTRTVKQFNTGGPITSYSVSRMGLDGQGSVSSVAGISPDSTGNVPLTADKLGALSLNGGTMAGSINMNGQRLFGLNDPTQDSEVATRAFVAKKIGEITPDSIGALSMELLWENASPASGFSEQTVPLNASGYDLIRVYCISTTSDSSILPPSEASVGETSPVLGYTTNLGLTARHFTVEKNGVWFGLCAYDGGTTPNSTIPYKIYGVKGVPK